MSFPRRCSRSALFLLMISSFLKRGSAWFAPRATVRRPSSARSSSSTQANEAAIPAAKVIPRAAVSVCVRCRSQDRDYYLLVQRGKEPNRGIWSLPGGKIEFGESTIAGGQRELREETRWLEAAAQEAVRWCPDTVCSTDSIGEGYHYLIAHCFAHLDYDDPPVVRGTDDADDAGWYTTKEIEQKCADKETTLGVVKVIRRMEELSSNGLLPTTDPWEL